MDNVNFRLLYPSAFFCPRNLTVRPFSLGTPNIVEHEALLVPAISDWAVLPAKTDLPFTPPFQCAILAAYQSHNSGFKGFGQTRPSLDHFCQFRVFLGRRCQNLCQPFCKSLIYNGRPQVRILPLEGHICRKRRKNRECGPQNAGMEVQALTLTAITGGSDSRRRARFRLTRDLRGQLQCVCATWRYAGPRCGTRESSQFPSSGSTTHPG